MNYAQYYRPPQGYARPQQPKLNYEFPSMQGGIESGIMGPRRKRKYLGNVNFGMQPPGMTAPNVPIYRPPMGYGYGGMGGYGGGNYQMPPAYSPLPPGYSGIYGLQYRQQPQQPYAYRNDGAALTNF